MTTWRVLTGDVRERLRELPAQSVQTCVTSPPYWGLRDYGHTGQIGLEASPEAYVAELVAVFGEVRRVLKDDGTCWINLGDSYAQGPSGSRTWNSGQQGGETAWTGNQRTWSTVVGILKPKDLCGVPWRVAFALQADGWYLRQDIVWHKPNPMPESVTDRCTKAHEYIFLLAKRERYFFDSSAIQEPGVYPAAKGSVDRTKTPMVNGRPPEYKEYDGWRNRRDVWTVTTQPYPEAHFATYPEDLIEPCILAGSRIGDTVLDPFTGSGTTGAVSVRHQRNFVGVELNPAYVELARKRIGNVAPLLASEVA